MTDRNEHQFDSFQDSPPSNVTEMPVTNQVPAHFLDSERVALYLTLAGLIEAGVSTTIALSLVQSGAGSRERANQVERLSEFFQTVKVAREEVKGGNWDEGSLPADIIGDTAELCFGKNFASSDELVLLRGLAHTDNIPAILKAAAEIVKAKSAIYTPTRPSAIPGRRLK